MPLLFLFFHCAAPIDYFGNSVNIKNDRIYLSKMRKDRDDKDKFTLIFVEQRGNHSKLTNSKREKTLDQYIDLIKSSLETKERLITFNDILLLFVRFSLML